MPPAPSGEDIDNYTFWYYTSDPKLAHRPQDLGVAAQHVETIDYDLDLSEAAISDDLAVTVRRPGDPRFAIAGTVAPSASSGGSFRAA